ncbi:MAPEG family protein [Rhodoferax sp. TBRC 17660]|uniref:MAPEG family protein n=1 Tax=Rhodoferax potami TaxID=3068338 RepID=A0ABU3KN79_9BURK|nr:MAPEG family protein [Rhodoferax sp. TBRC 17660]MDT7519229.1 MAPEG family protein [Rhodoferax sp. TBRC 17660]
MHSVAVTLFFAACCALMQCLLTVLVIRRRLKAGVYFLDGGDDPLLRRIRAHGNFAETAPMALLLMALLEFSGLGRVWLIVFGVALLLGRVIHATSLLTNHAAWSRSLGMALTIGVISIEAVCGLWLVFR